MEVNASSGGGNTASQPTAQSTADQTQSESTENTSSNGASGGSKSASSEKNPSDAHAAKVQAEKKAAQLKKYKYKVDGKEIEEEIDLSDDETIAKRLRGSRAVEENLMKSKETTKKAMEIVKQFESDPASILKRLPPDKARQIAEELLLGHIKSDMMSPQEKAELERKTKEEKERQAEREELESYRKKAREEQEYKLAQEFQETIKDALGKTKLPVTPGLIKKMAAKLKKSISLDLDLTAADLAAEVEKDERAFAKANISEMTAEQFIAIYGDDIANKIRKHDIEKLKAKQAELFQHKEVRQESKPQQESRPMTMEEWREQNERRVRGS